MRACRPGEESPSKLLKGIRRTLNTATRQERPLSPFPRRFHPPHARALRPRDAQPRTQNGRMRCLAWDPAPTVSACNVHFEVPESSRRLNQSTLSKEIVRGSSGRLEEINTLQVRDILQHRGSTGPLFSVGHCDRRAQCGSQRNCATDQQDGIDGPVLVHGTHLHCPHPWKTDNRDDVVRSLRSLAKILGRGHWAAPRKTFNVASSPAAVDPAI